jgi:hypothetical protein
MGTNSVAALPTGIGTPFVAMFSFSSVGTPSRRPIGWRFNQRASDARACASAPSGSKA